MSQHLLDIGWFGLGLLPMAIVTMLLLRWRGVGLGWAPVSAIVRASVQLAVIGLLLAGVFAKPWLVVAFVALMLSTASLTSAHRIAQLHHGRWAATIGVLCGACVAISSVFALGLMDTNLRYLIAVAGIVIGNTMNMVTLTGRNFGRLALDRRDQVEGWLALGATPQRAYRDFGALAIKEALIPSLDQTKATGLVTLPGAFVGAIMGGASPLEAAQFQLVVLAGIMLAMTITGLVVTAIIGRSPYVPMP